MNPKKLFFCCVAILLIGSVAASLCDAGPLARLFGGHSGSCQGGCCGGQCQQQSKAQPNWPWTPPTPTPSPTPTPAPVLMGPAITATLQQVTPAQQVVLAWSAQTPTAVVKAMLNGNIVTTSGEMVVYPTQTTTYVLMDFNSAGATEMADVTISVVPALPTERPRHPILDRLFPHRRHRLFR